MANATFISPAKESDIKKNSSGNIDRNFSKIYLGNNICKNLYLGNTKVKRVYLGNKELFGSNSISAKIEITSFYDNEKTTNNSDALTVVKTSNSSGIVFAYIVCNSRLSNMSIDFSLTGLTSSVVECSSLGRYSIVVVDSKIWVKACGGPWHGVNYCNESNTCFDNSTYTYYTGYPIIAKSLENPSIQMTFQPFFCHKKNGGSSNPDPGFAPTIYIYAPTGEISLSGNYDSSTHEQLLGAPFSFNNSTGVTMPGYYKINTSSFYEKQHYYYQTQTSYNKIYVNKLTYKHNFTDIPDNTSVAYRLIVYFTTSDTKLTGTIDLASYTYYTGDNKILANNGNYTLTCSLPNIEQKKYIYIALYYQKI